MVGAERFELSTYRLKARYSDQLSYTPELERYRRVELRVLKLGRLLVAP